ncbi:hypothetical protein PAMC26510_09795 [Caballeronia sordidicola]|uniref:Uncharacterized protein n=1 Tax=Caballeronia sordidicola TaxID=196367 RepID=A0A242MZX5_CABSO|nr:hypothetical protein PAMC26510_09795 [Caballeronia sordidicola]
MFTSLDNAKKPHLVHFKNQLMSLYQLRGFLTRPRISFH